MDRYLLVRGFRNPSRRLGQPSEQWATLALSIQRRSLASAHSPTRALTVFPFYLPTPSARTTLSAASTATLLTSGMMTGTMTPPRKRSTPSTGNLRIDPNFGAKRQIVDPNSGRQNLPLPTYSLTRNKKYTSINYKNPSTLSRTLTSHPGWHKIATANASRCTSNTSLSPPPARGAPLLRRCSASRRSSSRVDAHLAPRARTQSRG